MSEEAFLKGSSYLSKMVVPFCLSFVGGVFLASLFGFRAIFVALLVSWFVWFAYFSRNLVILLVIISGLFLGFSSTHLALKKIERKLPNEFRGEVVVLEDPVAKEEYQRILVEPIADEYAGVNFVVFQPLYPKYRARQHLNVECELEKPENRDERFNYIRYLAKNNIYRNCKARAVGVVEQKNEKRFSLFVLRNAIEARIGRLLPEPEAAYLAGLLLGGSDRLPVNVAEAFRLTGTTHVVAVSGYNITIVASVISAFLLFLGMWRGQSFWFSSLGIILFVFLVGAPSSAIRAAVMGILVLWAARNGRLANSGRSVLLTATLMILWSPLILVYDTGFQLSFLATIGIVYIYGPLSEKFKITNDFLELKSIILVTLSAQLSVAGIAIYQFGTFSPVSLFANFIIIPLIPFIMLGGSLMVLFDLIFPFFAKVISLIVWFALHFEIRTVETFSRLPWVSIQIDKVHWLWLISYYIFFLLLILYLQKINNVGKKKKAEIKTESQKI